MIHPTTVLATVTGRDRPGVTASFFTALAAHDVDVRDVEQVLVRDRLILTVVIELRGDATSLRNSMTRAAAALGMDCELEICDEFPDEPAPPQPRIPRCHVIILGNQLRPGAVGHVAQTIADAGGNIETVTQLGTTPISALELVVSIADDAGLRGVLIAAARDTGVDLAVESDLLRRRAKRLVVLDLDSTLIPETIVESLAHRAGVAEQMHTITARARAGELEPGDVLRAQAGLLVDVPATALDAARDVVQVGAAAVGFVAALRRLGFRVGVVSTGFGIAGVVGGLDLDFVASNELAVTDGRLTGALAGPVLDGAGKARALERFAAQVAVPLAQTVAVGGTGGGIRGSRSDSDDTGGHELLEAAGLGIAVTARAAASPYGELPYGDNVLFVLGLSPDEIARGAAAN